MTLDPHLLEKAKTAGDRLAEAERQVLLTRADYHTAIRRLHLAGASLRDIARALSLSHQRVQQVVSAAGGSWWQVWRRPTATRDTVCSWCDRSPAEVTNLIAGPKVFICDACVETAAQVAGGAQDSRGVLHRVGTGARHRCSFCSRRADGTRAVVIGPANVCSKCLETCREILNSRAESGAAAT